jgi:hypothetical protein
MTISKSLNRFSSAISVALSAIKVTMTRVEHGKAWALDTFERHTLLPYALSSRRPCPQCGGAMFYQPRPWSALTGKYLRSCEICDYTDVRAVKIVPQL